MPFDDISQQCVVKTNKIPIAQYLEEMGADFDPEILTFLMKCTPDTGTVRGWGFHGEHTRQTLLCEKRFPDYAECKSFL